MNFPASGETKTAARREPLSWDEKLLIFGFPTLLVLAAIAQFSLRGDESPAAIHYPAPAALPNPNGFDAYVAAEASIKLDVPAVDPIDDSLKFIPTDPKLAAQKYSLANKTAWLKANSAGFALFRQAQKLSCRSPEFAAGGGFNYGVYRPLAQLGRYKMIEANAFGMQKNWNGAVTASLDAIQMGVDITAGGSSGVRYISAQIQTNAREPLTSPTDPISKLSASQARAAARRLEAIVARRYSYAQTVENSRWVLLQEFDSFSQKPGWQMNLIVNQGREPTWREKLGFLSNPRNEIIADINRAFDDSIADLKKPFKTPFTPREPKNPLSANFGYSQSFRSDEARESVTLNMLLLRLALRAFQAETGRFPHQLSELSSRILRKIPVDAYADGAPFHFLWQGQKYRLYSVGPNGNDDGGKPLQEKYSSNGRSGQYNVTLNANLPAQPGDYVAGINH